MQTVVVRIHPPQPLPKFENPEPVRILIFDYRKPGFGPTAPAAVHRDYVAVAHFLKIVGGQGGTKSAATIKYDLRVLVRNGLFDVTFDDAFAQMDGAGNVTARPFAVFASVNENQGMAGVDFLFYFAIILFFDSFFRVFH